MPDVPFRCAAVPTTETTPGMRRAAAKLPKNVRAHFFNAFNACDVMDLYNGDVEQYMQIIAITLKERGERLAKLADTVARLNQLIG